MLRFDLMIITYLHDHGSRFASQSWSRTLLKRSTGILYDLMRNAASRLLDWAFVINPDRLVPSSRIL